MKIYLTVAAAFMLAAPSAASAADPPPPAPAEFVPPPAAYYDWTGFYLGIHGGHGWGKAEPETGTIELEPEGWFGGLQGGYNFQFPNSVVLGLEADISFGDIDDEVLDGLFLTQYGEIDHFGTARLRLGYAFDRVLPYVTGGLAWVHAKGGMRCPPGAPVFSVCGFTGAFDVSDSSTSVGWTIGAGVEMALTERWSAKVEYLHADFGSTTLTLDLPVVGSVSDEVDQTFNVVRAGLNYRF